MGTCFFLLGSFLMPPVGLICLLPFGGFKNRVIQPNCLYPTKSRQREAFGKLVNPSPLLVIILLKAEVLFLHRSRSIVILLQQMNCSRGEQNSSSIYIPNKPQLKVVSWRGRVNVLFSDFYSSHCGCCSKLTPRAPWSSESLKKESPEGLIYFLKVNGTIMTFLR